MNKKLFQIGLKGQHTSDLSFVTPCPVNQLIPPSIYAKGSLLDKLHYWQKLCYRKLPKNCKAGDFEPSTPSEANYHVMLSHIEESIQYYNTGDIELAFNSFLNASQLMPNIKYLQHEAQTKGGKARTGEATMAKKNRAIEQRDRARLIFDRLITEGETKENAYKITANQFRVKQGTVKRWHLEHWKKK